MFDLSWNQVFNTAAWLGSRGWMKFFFILLLGWAAAKICKRALRPLFSRMPEMTAQILGKSLTVLIWCCAAVQALHAVGVDVMSLLGAAGVAGIAVGFASQTALSNVISGMFIAAEHSVKLGDYIHSGNYEGTVEKISMLAITIRQPDNSKLRIPCEMLIKNPVSNETDTGMRRCAISVSITYGTDWEQVERLTARVVKESDFLLDTPAPVVRFRDFGDSGIDLLICAWCKPADYYETRYRFAKALYETFNREGISFAFPVRTLVHNDS